MNFGSSNSGGSTAKAWKDIWGCGQGIGQPFLLDTIKVQPDQSFTAPLTWLTVDPKCAVRKTAIARKQTAASLDRLGRQSKDDDWKRRLVGYEKSNAWYLSSSRMMHLLCQLSDLLGLTITLPWQGCGNRYSEEDQVLGALHLPLPALGSHRSASKSNAGIASRLVSL